MLIYLYEFHFILFVILRKLTKILRHFFERKESWNISVVYFNYHLCCY